MTNTLTSVARSRGVDKDLSREILMELHSLQLGQWNISFAITITNTLPYRPRELRGTLGVVNLLTDVVKCELRSIDRPIPQLVQRIGSSTHSVCVDDCN